jgi:hypothetical protein
MNVLQTTTCAYCGEPAASIATLQVAPKLSHVPREITLPIPVCAHCRPSFPQELLPLGPATAGEVPEGRDDGGRKGLA